jgi:hypothetical protein
MYMTVEDMANVMKIDKTRPRNLAITKAARDTGLPRVIAAVPLDLSPARDPIATMIVRRVPRNTVVPAKPSSKLWANSLSLGSSVNPVTT